VINVRHLSDERLIDVCLADAPVDVELQHLDSCPACEERRATIARVLDDVSAAAAAETDALFPADRLAKQRDRILQRVEREGRPARLIAFPAAASTEWSPRSRPAARWIAGAAAAGLIIGVLAGQLVRVRPAGNIARISSSGVVQHPEVGPLQAISTTMSEEEFLGRLEIAVEGTTGASLQPLDDLTPRVWEVAAQ
jgi:anti-sigma factor RsiW